MFKIFRVQPVGLLNVRVTCSLGGVSHRSYDWWKLKLTVRFTADAGMVAADVGLMLTLDAPSITPVQITELPSDTLCRSSVSSPCPDAL